MTLADWLRLKAHGQVKEAKAKAVIQLWMSGGPPHLDTFDPKPEAGSDYTGPLRDTIETNVPGIRISDHLPMMAKCADKYSIIRSMTHGEGGHETATYIMQTCTMPGELMYPSMGAVLAFKKYEAGYRGLPPYMAISSPLGRFTESGFLGTDYRVFATGGDPNQDQIRVEGLVMPGGVTPERFRDRRALLRSVDALATASQGTKELRDVDSFQERAYDMIQSEANKAFNMAAEKPEVRERYGRNRWGQSFLLAAGWSKPAFPSSPSTGAVGTRTGTTSDG